MKRRSVSSSLLFAILYGSNDFSNDFLQRFIIRHSVLHSRNAPTNACRVHTESVRQRSNRKLRKIAPDVA